MKESNAYILGTDAQELHRLGVQHQVWASEAQRGWELAGFRAGQTLLDLGCGPGFCTKELAFMVGETGRVIGVDKSGSYIEFLKQTAQQFHLNIDAIEADFNDMNIADNSLDGMYCRWALAWLPNPVEVLQKVYKSLKPGGTMVIHEYYDWSTHQTEPDYPPLTKAIKMALKSFKDSQGEIDIGRELPVILRNIGMEVTGVRLMSKLAQPDNLTWQWPKTFYYSYFPRIMEMGYLTQSEVDDALQHMEELEKNASATLCCPMMVEVIARK